MIIQLNPTLERFSLSSLHGVLAGLPISTDHLEAALPSKYFAGGSVSDGSIELSDWMLDFAQKSIDRAESSCP